MIEKVDLLPSFQLRSISPDSVNNVVPNSKSSE